MTEIPAPIHADRREVERWLGARGLDPARVPPAYSPVLSEQSFPPGDAELRALWDEGVGVCWLGGPAIGGDGLDWPVNSAGTPLAHVLSLGLESVAGTVDADGKAAWGGAAGPDSLDLLPATGSLEVFHDLSSFGYYPEDEPSGAWLVRWVPDPVGRPLVAGPGGGPEPTEVCQQVMPLPGFTIPSWEDVEAGDKGLGSAAFDAWEGAWLDLQRSWHVQRFGTDTEYEIPHHHVYGHPSHARGVADELLAQHLPVSEEDRHVLVAEVESWTALDGWFGDAGSLEVWMRAFDLAARRFDQAWCLVRTD